MSTGLNRVLLDANALLNATFISQSWSALVVAKLVAIRSTIVVGSHSTAEAKRVARNKAKELGKRDDPAAFIDGFIRGIAAVEVPPSKQAVNEAIPDHDRHVVQEAIAADATLFTADTQLCAACTRVGYAAVHPLAALELLDGPAMQYLVFGIAPRAEIGSFFARVVPGDWAGRPDIGDFTVAHFDGQLWLYYSTSKGGWFAQMPEVGTLYLPFGVTPTAPVAISVSWQASRDVRLRVGAANNHASLPLPKPLSRPLAGPVSIGQTTNGEHNWNGGIRVCVMNDRAIGNDLWRELSASPDLAPNPFDADRLQDAMNRVLR